MLDFSVIARNLDYLLLGQTADRVLGGLTLTLAMAVAAAVLALTVGIALAVLAWRHPGWTRLLLFLWADVIRGIPLILVIFWLYFLLPALLGGDLPSALTVILALAWFTSAAVMYTTLAAIEALPAGQLEAARAAGFSDAQALRLILLPQALRNLVPSYVGLLVSLIKDTSLAFIINVPELTTVAGQVNSREQVYPVEIFLFLTAVYFVLCEGLSLGASALARRLRREGRNSHTTAGSFSSGRPSKRPGPSAATQSGGVTPSTNSAMMRPAAGEVMKPLALESATIRPGTAVSPSTGCMSGVTE
jgi:polar amino acid transport system permease protein